ncbi:MAG: flagellar biosynthesis protein FliR [Sphingomonadales bacterium]|nr:flagellar biosynthesis protein FliR [Sphingomonadales bacterium]
MNDLTDQALATLLLSLRIAPTLGFAPPFTLVPTPAMLRLLLGVALAAWLVAAFPDQTWRAARGESLIVVGATELFLGISLALALQLAFAALLTVGRTIDIQAGFGLAALVDPATRAQMPLVGTLFAYAAAAIFFATDGPANLVAIWAASVDQVPLGGAGLGDRLGIMTRYVSTIFGMAFGAAGLLMLVLFVIDLAIAFMSRTLPQMNVLVLGFQVKTLAVLAVLPIAIAIAISSFLAMLRYALETTALLT